MAAGRTLHVRCGTWDQVEVFHTRKLRRGKFLSMKVPFTSEAGVKLTLSLELPNGVVIAIDGIVQKSSPVEADTKTWIEVELVGFTSDVVARIRAMQAATERVPPPVDVTAAPEPISSGDDSAPTLTLETAPPVAVASRPTQPHAVPGGDPTAPSVEPEPPSRSVRRPSQQMAPLIPPVDGNERAHFQQLTADLRRMRQLAVHEVLGVERDADADEIRRGWMDLVKRFHPDLVARHGAPAVTHLAEELTILANRAYDRLRMAMVAEGRATSAGSALQPPPGWLVGFEDIASEHGDRESARPRMSSSQMPPLSLTTSQTAPAASAVQGGEAFEVRARAMLGEGNADNAQEVLAAALCVYPRSRPLRSLYYVASALGAIAKGEVMLATSQLETALAHYEQCTEAATLLEEVRRHGTVEGEAMRRLFS